MIRLRFTAGSERGIETQDTGSVCGFSLSVDTLTMPALLTEWWLIQFQKGGAWVLASDWSSLASSSSTPPTAVLLWSSLKLLLKSFNQSPPAVELISSCSWSIRYQIRVQ